MWSPPGRERSTEISAIPGPIRPPTPWLRASPFIALDALATYFLLTADQDEGTGSYRMIGAEYLLVSRIVALTIDVPAVQRRNALAASGFRF
ncbi:MAG: hypothetical protein ACOZIN_17105 [Myxococcota bacterium]